MLSESVMILRENRIADRIIIFRMKVRTFEYFAVFSSVMSWIVTTDSISGDTNSVLGRCTRSIFLRLHHHGR